METASGEYERLLSEYEESRRKNERMGSCADVLIQLHVRDPLRFDAVYIMNELVIEHEKIGFEEIKKSCRHVNNETVPVGGDETITICHDCGDEL